MANLVVRNVDEEIVKIQQRAPAEREFRRAEDAWGIHVIPQRDFERARFNLKDEIAFLDFVPLLESHVAKLAVHPRLDRDAGVGVDVSDGLELDRHIFLRGHSERDRHRHLAPRGGRFAVAAGASRRHQGKDRQRRRRQQQRARRHGRALSRRR